MKAAPPVEIVYPGILASIRGIPRRAGSVEDLDAARRELSGYVHPTTPKMPEEEIVRMADIDHGIPREYVDCVV
jgi:hypothetical protein